MLVSGIFIGLQESRSLAETSQGLFWGGGGGEAVGSQQLDTITGRLSTESTHLQKSWR